MELDFKSELEKLGEVEVLDAKTNKYYDYLYKVITIGDSGKIDFANLTCSKWQELHAEAAHWQPVPGRPINNRDWVQQFLV